MRTRFILLAAGLVLALSVTSSADWDPGNGHKMHYPQLPLDMVFPDSNGLDVGPIIRLADDWRCSESGYVTDIHFWISWLDDMVQPIGTFWVTIWSDNPAGPHGWSIPDTLLWDCQLDPAQYEVRDMEDHLQDYFDFTTGDYFPENHVMWQQVNIVGIEDPFYQEEGTTYWLEIDMPEAMYAGWKVSGSEHFRDDAVYWWFPYWYELRHPFTGESLDLAFVITGGSPSSMEPSTWGTESSTWGRIKTLLR